MLAVPSLTKNALLVCVKDDSMSEVAILIAIAADVCVAELTISAMPDMVAAGTDVCSNKNDKEAGEARVPPPAESCVKEVVMLTVPKNTSLPTLTLVKNAVRDRTSGNSAP
tara:strand:+ start:1037 stop:1369 length:333 start_codon:yes stop_codon:yes gene_type:complete